MRQAAPLRLGVAAALAAALAACGGARHVDVGDRAAHATPHASVASEEPHGPANPTAVVAQVGPYAISGAMFDRFVEAKLDSEPASERLALPLFSACVAHLQAELTDIGERAPPPAQIRGECAVRYRALLQSVLERLITSEWLIGGAHELRTSVDDHAPFETQARLASEAIAQAIKGRVRPISQVKITAYYRRHKFEYLVAGRRDLKIVRTESATSAATVRAEIASGRSFASVVKTLPVQQPADAGEGFVEDLPPHYYGEPNLNEAIFTTAPGVLSAPIDTWFGWFVFEVTRIRLEREKPLAQVAASIRTQLESPLQEQALASFGRRWRVSWAARTTCSPGYVVPKCRGFKGAPVGPVEAAVVFK
jgi:hypothetical protein